jgi:hypothetical protein
VLSVVLEDCTVAPFRILRQPQRKLPAFKGQLFTSLERMRKEKGFYFFLPAVFDTLEIEVLTANFRR